MKVLTIGSPTSLEEFKKKFEDPEQKIPEDSEIPNQNKSNLNKLKNDFIYITDYEDINEKILNENQVVFDFFLNESIDSFEIYKDQSDLIIFANIPKSSLIEFKFYFGNFSPTLYGFNGLPGMINRKYLELTASSKKDADALNKICQELGTDYLIVDDRVGMVTPRILSMVINEAYFTVQEGTANKEDIDMAMKLGTNYPWGPFEWCQKYGVRNIYELLEALYEDTKDERYKICPLLKREYMMELQ